MSLVEVNYQSIESNDKFIDLKINVKENSKKLETLNDEINENDQNLIELESFNVDGDIVAKPIYDIEKQEKLDNRISEGIHEFYSNNYQKAEEIFSKYLHDPLHMLGDNALKYMKALVTFDKVEISKTIKELDKTEKMASKQLERIIQDEKKMGNSTNIFSKIIKKKEKTINNAKIRTMIIRAECNLLAASLYLFQENMVGFLKAALRLKKVWSFYSTCWNAIKDNLEESRKQMDKHTFNGVLFGIGSSKLLISVLPPKILSVISVLGVTSDRNGGLKLLNQCIEDTNLYSPMALSAQLFYFSILNSLAPSTAKDSIKEGQRLINIGTEMFPNSAIQQYFEGRFIRLIRDLDSSTQAFSNSNKAQNYWKELNLLNQYELSLNAIFNLDWEDAIKYNEVLIEEKYYSDTLFAYLSGILNFMIGDSEKTKESFNLAKEYFKIKRGKLIDIEEYTQSVISRIEHDNYEDVEVALMEFMYLWDGLPSMSFEKLQKLYDIVEKFMERKSDSSNSINSNNNKNQNVKLENEKLYIMHLIKGSILRELEKFEESEKELNIVLTNGHLLNKKSYILPFTYFELGLLNWTTKKYVEAQKYLNKSKNYKGYFMEFRLDIKVQRTFECIKNDNK